MPVYTHRTRDHLRPRHFLLLDRIDHRGRHIKLFCTKSRAGNNRYSGNPGYVGWALVIFGMSLIGWSFLIWSFGFLLYFIQTISFFHWPVLLEEEFLVNKYGDTYRQYISRTSRNLGMRNG